jgi:putative transposase
LVSLQSNSPRVLKKNLVKSSSTGNSLGSRASSPPNLAKTLINQLPSISRRSICRVLKTSRSNSYRASKIRMRDKLLVEQINQIRLQHKHYGLKRIKQHFETQGRGIGLNQLRRVSKLYNLAPKPYYSSPYKNRDKGLADTKIPNLIKELAITRPNQVWSSDFTYLKFQGYFYYLATVIDAYTKEITGFSLSTNHNTDLIKSALNRGIKTYGTPDLTHNDQGSEYRSEEYLNLLSEHSITPSNSAKASPWENAYQESFYGKFKPELELNQLPYGSTFMDLYNYIANQIEYYNNYRIHTSIMDIPSNHRKRYNLTQVVSKSTLNEREFIVC